MSKRVAVYGATGAVGSALLIHMLKGSVLRPGDEIVLVARDEEVSRTRLLAVRTDLLDAFADGIVGVSVCPSLRELDTDIFIMTAGATISRERPERRDLAAINCDVFDQTACLLADRNPQAFVFLISNPVELGVSIFARHINRNRVVGIGAQQDSLRFARAIADRLGVHRSIVRASVLGEHGRSMLPIWSSVYLTDSSTELASRLDSLREKCSEGPISELAARIKTEASVFAQNGDLESAYELLHCVAPEIRIMVEPVLTANALHSTPNATANATVSCLDALLRADERKIHGQVLLDGEFYGLQGVCGTPISLQATGWHVAAGSETLTKVEVEHLKDACFAIRQENESIDAVCAQRA